MEPCITAAKAMELIRKQQGDLMVGMASLLCTQRHINEGQLQLADKLNASSTCSVTRPARHMRLMRAWSIIDSVWCATMSGISSRRTSVSTSISRSLPGQVRCKSCMALLQACLSHTRCAASSHLVEQSESRFDIQGQEALG